MDNQTEVQNEEKNKNRQNNFVLMKHLMGKFSERIILRGKKKNVILIRIPITFSIPFVMV